MAPVGRQKTGVRNHTTLRKYSIVTDRQTDRQTDVPGEAVVWSVQLDLLGLPHSNTKPEYVNQLNSVKLD